jgi:MFS family permease
MENPVDGLRVQVKERVINVLQFPKTTESRNAWNLYGDIAWFGVLSGIVQSFLSVFVIRLGGSDTHVGLLTALPALVAIFFSIPGSRLVEREGKPLSVLLISGSLNRVGYLAIALLPIVLATRAVDGVVVMVALLSIPAAVANVAFTTMFGQAVKPEHRARVVSIRSVWIGITSTLIALLGGKFLDLVLFPINYQILFAVAFAASMASIYYLSRIRLPEATRAGTPSPRAELPRGARAFIDMLRSSDGYMRFALTSFLFQWGMFFTTPLYSIYWVRNLNASDGWVGVINMVGSATTILFFPLWGRLTARRGNRIAMVLTTAGMAAYPFTLALAPSVEWAVVVSFWGGVVSSGQALSFFNGLLEVCPESNRSSYIAAYNSLVNIAAFASPILSTSLTEVYGIQAMLFVGAGMRLLASFLIWRRGALAVTRLAA